MTTFAQGQIILAGDLNYVIDVSKDKSHFRRNQLKNRISSLTQLDSLLKEFDIGLPTIHPTEVDYTYYSHRHNVHRCIDYSAHIGPKILTDHAWVECSMKRPTNEHKTPIWSLNKSLLFSEIDCALLKEGMNLYFETNQQSISSETDMGCLQGLYERQTYCIGI